MKSQSISNEEQNVIEKLIETENLYWQLIFKLRDISTNPQTTVTHLPWKKPSTWDFIESLDSEQRKEIFFHILDTVVDINHPCRDRAFRAIYQLPRQWVLDNLESKISPLLEKYDEEAYHTIIQLYEVMDIERAIQWAINASQHDNPHIQETGNEWLEAHK